MKTIKALALSLAITTVLAVAARAVNTCTGYNVSNMCIPAANILEGTMASGVLGSGCGAANLPQGVAITYQVTAGSAAFGVAPNLSTFTSAGVLQLASVLQALYGGNGADLHACAVGAVPYFTSTGVEACLSAGTQNYVLQANGAGAPSFTNAPTILGTNVTAVPAANILAGSLGAGAFVVTGALSATGNLIIAPGTAYTSTITAASGNIATPGSVTAGGGFVGALTGAASSNLLKAGDTMTGKMGLYVRNRTQVAAITPAAQGETYWCSDCNSTGTIVVSTGTGVGAFGMMTWTSY